MVLAGLTGGIGHGKTTFSRLLAQHAASSAHFETWELVAEVAAALRLENNTHPSPDDMEAVNVWLYPLAELVSLHMHAEIAYEQLKLTQESLKEHPEYYDKLFEYLRAVEATPSLADSEITDETKAAFRPLLQWLGGYLVAKVGSGVWYDEIVRRIAHLRSTGTELVTVGGVRYPGDAERLRNAGGMILEIKRPDLPEQDAKDITERERTLITADSLVINDGSLEDLAHCAAIVYGDLQLRQLQPEYRSADGNLRKK